ncbi:MAG: nucleotide sugar dehydrogenase [Myxococcales bacterium]|nr:nucleotide sugar dehydrogenase [Myxococcales bacterium]
MPRVTVIGLGYMGLPTALLLARDQRLEVAGCDISGARIEALQRGELPFDEAGLPELFAEVRQRFSVSTSAAPSDAFILALPTPLGADRRCDLGALHAATDALAPIVRDGDLVIVESTVTPGTTAALGVRLREHSGKRVDLAYVSEKAIPGKTLHEMVHNDRIIGADDPAIAARVIDLYQGFVRGQLVTTTSATAEAAKLFENTYRDVNIALANELSELAEHHGIDVHETIALANRHPRVQLLSPGPGVGGHCIAIDPWFLVQDTEAGALIRTARGINDGRPERVAERVCQHAKPEDGPIVLLGVAYKADVDDERESPTHAIAAALQTRGHSVRLHDPHVRRPGVEHDLESALRGAAGAVLVTDHSAYRDLDLAAHGFSGRWVLDTRGLWSGRELGEVRYLRMGAPGREA